MASIPLAPLVLKDVLITFGANGYEKHVSGVKFVPKSSTIAWHGLTPGASFTDTTAAEWTCQLDYVQDWTTTDSLARYLLANAGLSVSAVFKPQAAALPSFAATIVIAPGPIGGDEGKFATSSVTLGSSAPVPTFV